METVKNIVGIILVFASVNGFAQKPNNGIYRGKNGFICVNSDTIIMDVHAHGSYYLGVYSMNGDEIVFGKNELIGKNAKILTDKCYPDSIEIMLICKYELIFEEADKYPRQSMRCFFYSDETKGINSKEDGIIYIGVDETKRMFNIENFYVGDRVQFQFNDIFQIPLEYGKRYVISQKYTASALFLDGDTSWLSFKVKKRGKRIEMYHKRAKTKEVFYYEGECDSCLEEFKKQFPGLIE